MRLAFWIWRKKSTMFLLLCCVEEAEWTHIELEREDCSQVRSQYSLFLASDIIHEIGNVRVWILVAIEETFFLRCWGCWLMASIRFETDVYSVRPCLAVPSTSFLVNFRTWCGFRRDFAFIFSSCRVPPYKGRDQTWSICSAASNGAFSYRSRIPDKEELILAFPFLCVLFIYSPIL